MKREHFDSMVQSLHARAAANPGAFTLRTALWAGFGFAYMMGVLVLCCAATLLLLFLLVRFPNAATIKFGIIGIVGFGSMSLALARGLWVRIEPPSGLELTPGDAPLLFEEIKSLQTRLDSPPFHRVLLVDEFNAAVVQTPRLGALGWYQNTLIIGLPLLQCLGLDEFRAVLAHEFGHLSRKHGGFGNWLYRLRRSWSRVFEEIERRQVGKLAFLLTRFIDWFWPRFNAHAFVLSRINEYQADKTAAEIAGAQNVATALLRICVHGAAFSKLFWKEVLDETVTSPKAAPDVFERSARFFAQPLSADVESREMRAAFLMETNNLDTHPSLKDRWSSLGIDTKVSGRETQLTTLPPVLDSNAAEALLGENRFQLAGKLGAEWSRNIQPAWEQQHREAQEIQSKIAQSQLAPDASIETLWTSALELIRIKGDEGGLPLIENILGQMPEHPGACFVRGRHYLESDDPAGVEWIEKAIRLDESLTRQGAGILHAHFNRTGQPDRKRQIEQMMDTFEEKERLATEERSNITDKDQFIPHDLSPGAVAELKRILATELEIFEAVLACKKVHHFPTQPAYVMGLKVKVPWWKLRSEDANQKLLNRLHERLQFPHFLLLFCIEKDQVKMGKAIRNIPGSVVYSRE